MKFARLILPLLLASCQSPPGASLKSSYSFASCDGVARCRTISRSLQVVNNFPFALCISTNYTDDAAQAELSVVSEGRIVLPGQPMPSLVTVDPSDREAIDRQTSQHVIAPFSRAEILTVYPIEYDLSSTAGVTASSPLTIYSCARWIGFNRAAEINGSVAPAR